MLLLLLLPVPTFATDLVSLILRQESFVLRLKGEEDSFLYSVQGLGQHRIGIVILEPTGFTKSRVYDAETMRVILEEVIIHEKSVRDKMRENSILIGDAKRLVQSFIELKYSEP